MVSSVYKDPLIYFLNTNNTTSFMLSKQIIKNEYFCYLLLQVQKNWRNMKLMAYRQKKLFVTMVITRFRYNKSQSNFFAALYNIFAIFRPFCDIIAALQFIASYYRQLCNIMLHYMPIKLLPQKLSFRAIRRRYIASDYIMLYNNYASGGEKV